MSLFSRDVEICLSGHDAEAVRQAVRAAREGGAARIELCRALDRGGLTPTPTQVEAAREAWGGGRGLLVMVRPHDHDFCYTSEEARAMAAIVEQATSWGADGVVFGALQAGGKVDEDATRRMTEAAQERGLSTTFHRAFDAAADPAQALETVIKLGLDRVLTCGVPWGQSGTAWDGLPRLRETVTQAAGRIEIVIGGGLTPPLLSSLQDALPTDAVQLSFHAHSGAQQDGVTTASAVRALVKAAQKHGS
ncbi:MAG: copper homeostasis protein CutC [Armatimonadota bacterium]|nr:copper homeostasis protein CutC [Armatimonadota bacterium]